jgi:hypothetical protein
LGWFGLSWVLFELVGVFFGFDFSSLSLVCWGLVFYPRSLNIDTLDILDPGSLCLESIRWTFSYCLLFFYYWLLFFSYCLLLLFYLVSCFVTACVVTACFVTVLSCFLCIAACFVTMSACIAIILLLFLVVYLVFFVFHACLSWFLI